MNCWFFCALPACKEIFNLQTDKLCYKEDLVIKAFRSMVLRHIFEGSSETKHCLAEERTKSCKAYSIQSLCVLCDFILV
jgi:hypothetical protein